MKYFNARNYSPDLECLNEFKTDSILCCNEEIFYFILNNGGSLKDSESWFHPIEYAIKTFNVPLVKYIYKECHLYANFVKYSKKTLLFFAHLLKNSELVKYFKSIR